ncbi:MAG: ABC transporter ATP-binding protein [Bacteroidaceae bacterium]|nr:ABC transporter ATP-binding protein [Bacteroidaceae bacterium]
MRTENLSIGYPTRVVASGVNISLHPGSMVCLIGENGTGKSTLLRTLAGFLSPLDGSITIDAPEPIALHELPKRQLARLVSVVLTDRISAQNTSVRELIAMGRMPYTGFFGRLSADDNRIVDVCLSETGIGAERLVNTLSDGELQKVMIARALAQQTRYIFLDEPTAFLDYPSKVRTMENLKKLAHNQGKTILLSTHDIEIALCMADCIIMMERNGEITEGRPKRRDYVKITDFTADSLLERA